MMRSHMKMLRADLKLTLQRLGLLPAVRWIRELIMVLARSEHRRRRERVYHQRFLRFKRQYGDVLRYNLNTSHGEEKKVLVVGVGFPEVEIELGLIKALELSGFTPVVLISHRRQNLEYYNLAGVKEALFLSEFADPPDLATAEAIIERFRSVQELLLFEYAGARVGKYVVQTAMQDLRCGFLDLQSTQVRRMLVHYFASGMASATAAQRILHKVHPLLALFHDRVYTPEGQLFDNCWVNGIDAIRWHPAHKSNALILKRYTFEHRDEHPMSLSSKSWELIREMEWTGTHHEQIQQELYSAYSSGDWYSEAGTQFKKRVVGVDDIRWQIGIDLSKKTAIIFPHISWDAPFSWGTCLFHSYEEWLIETVRAACTNDQLNWVIKIHPANVGKAIQDGFHGEAAEVNALRQHFGELPPHILFIPADSPISTFSLFAVMDYCLTVRGTIGIEAARLGIPVLTAGTGRYDHRGFTIDSDTREEYLDRLTRIQDISRLSPSQRELADRYAYGLFVMRPLPLKTVTFRYPDQENHRGIFIKVNTQINISTKGDWYNASDLKAFAIWVNDSNNPDFLMPLPNEKNVLLL